MDFTQIEINKHKTNICNLAIKLSNTFNINEEILINNEIKKETEILQSLLNIKNQYQMNNPQFIMHQQQIMAQKQMIQQQFIQQMQQDQSMQQQQINLFFEIHGERTVIRINPEKKFKEAIEKFRNKIGNFDELEFVFNNQKLYPEENISKSELRNFSVIYVIPKKGTIGG